jgi:hypothetical protein
LVHVTQIVQTDEAVDLGDLPSQIERIPIGHAAGHQDLLHATLFRSGDLQDGIDRLLFRLLDETAGVHDDRFGISDVVDDAVPPLAQLAEHDLAVHPVLRAAQTDHAHPLGWFLLCHERRRV